MAADFESLNFEISVNAGDAVKQVSALASAIGRLARNLGKLNVDNIPAAFNNVSASAKKAAKDIEGVVSASEQLKKAPLDKSESSAALSEFFFPKKTVDVKDVKQMASDAEDAMQRVRAAMGSVDSGNTDTFKALAPNFKKQLVDVQDIFAEMGKQCGEAFNNTLYGALGAAPKVGNLISSRMATALPDTASFGNIGRRMATTAEDVMPGFGDTIARQGADVGRQFWENFSINGREAVDKMSAQVAGQFSTALSGGAPAHWAKDAEISAANEERIFTSLISQTKSYTQVTQALTSAKTALTPAMQAAGVSAKAFGTAIDSLAAPISAVVLAIQLAVKAATFLADQFNDFVKTMNKFKEVAQEINEKYNPFVALKKELDSLLALAKRQVMRRAINAVIKAVTEGLRSGIDNLAQYDEQFSATMESFHNAMGLFKNSIGVAVAPIISYFIPAINALLSALTRAMNMLARLTALLTGQHTYTIAKDYQEIGDSAGGASGKVKELQRTILGFDEINRLNRPSGSGGGGGGGASDAISAYETVDVGEWMYDSWGEALLAFIQWLDGTGVPKLKSALEKVASVVNTFSRGLYDALTYEGVQDAISNLATHLGETLNNFLTGGEGKGGLNWADMGKAVGMAIQTAFNFAANFVRQLDFFALGQSIAEFINNAVEQLKPEDIAEVLFTPIRAAFGLLTGFLNDFDFPQFAEKAGQVVNRLVEGIAKLFGEQVADKNGNIQTKLEIAINNIADGIVRFFDTVNWEQLFNTLTNVVSSIIRGLEAILKKVMQNKEFVNAVHQFIDFMINTAVRWFMLKVRAITGLAGNMNFGRLIGAAMFGGSEGESLFGDGLGFFGSNFSEQTIADFTYGMEEATESVDDLSSAVGKGIPTINQYGRTATNSISSVSNAAKDMDTNVQTAARGVSVSGTNVVNAFRTMTTNSGKPLSDLSKSVNTNFTNAKNSITNNMASAKNAVTNNMNTAKTNAVNGAEALRSGVASKFNSVASDANTKFANMRDNIKGRIAEAKNGIPAFNDVGANIKNGVIAGMGDFKGQLNNWCYQFKDQILKNFKIKSPSRWARDMVGVNIGEGISLGLEESTSSVMNACEGIKEGITSELSGAEILGNVKSSGGTDIATALGNQVMSAISTMDTNRNDQPIVCEVYLDRDRIASAVTRGQQAQNRRYSSTAMA